MEPAVTYDSTADTLRHSRRVGELMVQVISELAERSVRHDLSKTEPPERDAFDAYSPRLATLTYGTEECRACLREMRPAIEHHYAHNAHHPEHYPNGVAGMTLVDLVELLADWRAAGERMAGGGSLTHSFEVNKPRFNLSDQLLAVLENTARHFGWMP